MMRRLRYAYGLCTHNSHRLQLPCLRVWTYQGQCAKHNQTCFTRCKGDLLS